MYLHFLHTERTRESPNIRIYTKLQLLFQVQFSYFQQANSENPFFLHLTRFSACLKRDRMHIALYVMLQLGSRFRLSWH